MAERNERKEHAPVILHLDMDAFFASVEEVDDPSLKGKPVIIGASDRGVVSAASYAARKFGVHSAMPVARARKLCPQGIFLPGRHKRYGEVSRLVMREVTNFSPLVEQTSVDEAYVDITGMGLLHESPRALAMRMKERIREVTGLTCSVGIAPNKFLAKICSDINKPDGIYILPPQDVPAFLTTLPVGRIPGVGKRFEAELHTLGVRHASDILRFTEAFWTGRLGEKAAQFLYARARGEGNAVLRPHAPPKSSGAENTFRADTDDREELKRWLMRQAERVGRDLRKEGYFGRTVTLKMKFKDFRTITRSRTLARPVQCTDDIFRAAEDLLAAESLPMPLRLIGVSVSGLSRGERQLGLWDEPGEEEMLRLDKALDAINEKFGGATVFRGRTFDFWRTGK